jgi:putative phosphoesterase
MIGIVSDAHGNTPAFRRAVRVLKHHGAKEFVFLGDAVGYFPSTGVVDAISAMGDEIACIKGNHEKMLLEDTVDSGRDAVYQLAMLRRLLTAKNKEMLESWPDSRDLTIGGRSVLFVHGSPHDPINGYVYPDSDLSVFNVGYDFVFMGHSHYPFVRTEGATCFVNVGSVGLPRDDGRFGSCALFDPDNGQVEILRFDIHKMTIQLFDHLDVHPAVRSVAERRKAEVFGVLKEDTN